MCAGFALLFASTFSAAAQDRTTLVRHCLSIADVNERVDCLETGGTPNSAPAPDGNLAKEKQLTQTPSYDCRAARSSIERAICADPTLSESDAQMGRVFQQTLRLAKNRQFFLDSQRVWLSQRDSICGALADNVIWSCVLEMTKARTASLAKSDISGADVVPASQISPTIATPPPITSQSQSYSSVALIPSSRPTSTVSETVSLPQTTSQESSHGLAIWLVFLGAALGTTIVLVTRHKERIALENQRLAEENRQRAEVQRLVAKYGEHSTARILAHEIWQGMTQEELLESRGNPSDLGREIIRDKTRETWKYHQIGRNRFRERIYLENGIVIGWKI